MIISFFVQFSTLSYEKRTQHGIFSRLEPMFLTIQIFNLHKQTWINLYKMDSPAKQLVINKRKNGQI